MNRIRDLRLAANMTQAQLGDLIGCVGQTVSKFEKESRQLDPATICSLCELFHVTADYLLGRSNVPMPVINDADARILAAYHDASDRDRALVDQIFAAYMEDDQGESAPSSAS